MSVIVRDDGFHADDLAADLPASAVIGLDTATAPADLPAAFDGVTLIRIAVPAFNDGRGFTLARRLRAKGYQGRLRAVGPLIADQYAMARRSGFDEVEIPDEIAERQPADQWVFRANWRDHDYRSRLSA